MFIIKYNLKKLFFASIFFTILFRAQASTPIKENYFCTKYNVVNFRNGPGIKFTIIYKVYKKDYPVKVLETIEGWHAVIDFKEDKMWVSGANLTHKCGGIIKAGVKAPVRIYPAEDSIVLFTLDEGFTTRKIKCYRKWCRIKIQNKTGWIEKSYIWGV